MPVLSNFRERARYWQYQTARALLALFALALTALAVFFAFWGDSEVSRLNRLSSEGRDVTGVIVRIDVERRRVHGEGSASSPVYETHRLARVRYVFGDITYEPEDRHSLVGDKINLTVGSPFALRLLPDEPGHPYAPDTLAGSWFVAFAMPLLLVMLAALCGAVAWFWRPQKPRMRQK